MGRLALGQFLEQRLIRARLANRLLVKEDEPLQIDFLDADLSRNFHECRKLRDGLFQAGEPDGNLRLVVSLPLLQLAKRAHVASDAAEIIPAADRLERLA